MYLSNFEEKLLWEMIVATKIGLLLDRDWSTLDCFVNSENVLFSHLTQKAFLQFYLTRTLKPFINKDHWRLWWENYGAAEIGGLFPILWWWWPGGRL